MSTSCPEPLGVSSLASLSSLDLGSYGCALLTRNGRIVSVTRSFAQMLGSSTRLLIGQSIFEFLVPTQGWKNHRSLLDGGTTAVLCRGRRVNLTMHKIAPGGALGGSYIALIGDERADAEPILSHLKGSTAHQSAAELVHDIVGPLNVIANTAELLLTDDEVSSEGRDALELMREEAYRLAHLLRGFLSTTRNRPSQIAAPRLIELVNKCVRLSQSETTSRRIVCKSVGTSDIPSIAGDETGLTQVLLNLIKNAIDATEPGGEIQITIGSRQFEDGNPAVELRIVDNGTGIPAAQLHRVFEPFYTTKPAGKGTGIGLAIARRIVSEHRGQLTLTSIPGKGTTATVLLPVFTRKAVEIRASQRRMRDPRDKLTKRRRIQTLNG